MFFVKRDGDYQLAESSRPDDLVFSDSVTPEFKRYVEYTKERCGDYSSCKFPDSYFGNVRPWDYSRVLEYGDFDPDQRVLECGGLHSYFAVYLSSLVKHYTCTDSFYWATHRDYSKDERRYQTPKEWCSYLEGFGKITAEEADLQKMGYPSESFDKVVCISVIEHVPKEREGMKEMLRMLKPGGSLLLTTEYNPSWSRDYTEDDGSFYRVYDDAGIDKLVAGFDVEVRKVHSADVKPGSFTTLFLRIRK